MKEEAGKAYWLEVWSRFQKGDKEAFADLYNLHINALYSYGTKLCKDEEAVKDALQDLYLDLFLRCKTIRIDVGNLKYYLMLALKRNLISKLEAGRKLMHQIKEPIDFHVEFSIEFQMIEHETKTENSQRIIQAMNQLPSGQKEALYLRYNESLEYEEVAKILRISVESARKQVYRALKTVREMIDNQSITILFAFLSKKV